MIRFEINQEIVPARLRLSGAWLHKLFAVVSRNLELRGTHTHSIAFVDHRTMRHLNRTYRGQDRVTDILSFAPTSTLRIKGGSGELRNLGELLLAWPYVRDQAEKNEKTLSDELALLLIHGVLHLCGYDHETKKDAAKMLPLQDRILRDFLKRYRLSLSKGSL